MAAAVFDFSPGFRIRAGILAALRSRPLTAVELAAVLPFPYREIVAALPSLIERGKIEQAGYRYRLVMSEEPEGDDAA